MTTMRIHVAIAVLCLAACGDDGEGPDDTLYTRMGGEAGVRALVDDILVRVTADEKINGYFRNVSVDRSNLAGCMVKQIGAATGGPQTYPDAGCRDMAAAHAGLGVSRQDFEDFVADVTAAVDATDLSSADRTELLASFSGHHADVVEDEDNNATVYQRVGRKPAISTVVTNFETRVAGDAAVNGFFAGIQDFTRIHACLTRQVCSIDGPCRYGEETPDEFPGLTNQGGCRPMAASHFGLQDLAGNPIVIEDFLQIAMDLALELDAAGVAPADRDAVIGALGPLCADIVANGTGCP
jgi:hemoglobin